MAKGGWIYAPTAESNDMATCIYCDLALDGWEAADGPTEQHSKRVQMNCAFFAGLMTTGSAQTILELTKNGFSTEKADSDVVSQTSTHSRKTSVSEDVPEKKRGKRKLLGKSKLVVAEVEEEPESIEPIPIILQSARKKRPSGLLDPESSPVKRPRHMRTRSNSFTGGINYAELLLTPPDRPERKSRTKRLDVISDLNSEPKVEEESSSRGRQRASSRARAPSTRRGSASVPIEEVLDVVDESKVEEESSSRGRQRASSRARAPSKRRGSSIAVSAQEENVKTVPDTTAPVKSRRGSRSVSRGRTPVEKAPTRRSTSRKRSNVPAVNIEDVLANRPVPARRTSSRRGSGTSTTNIEDIVMLDHKARVRVQKPKKAKLEVSTESIEEQDPEVVEALEMKEETVESTKVDEELPSIAEAPLESVAEAEEPDELKSTSPKLLNQIVPKPAEPEVKTPEEPVETVRTPPDLPEDYADVSMIEITDTPAKPISSKWTDIPRNVYDHAMLPATLIRQFADLPPSEQDMTVEQWLRMYTKREVARLNEHCQSMIDHLIQGGERAKAAIML